MWGITIMRFKRDKRGISNVIVVMLSLVLVVVIVGNVVLWSYQMNQLDWERIQENLNILSASRATASSWFTAQNEFDITQGSITGGSYQDTTAQDESHETFIEEANETTQVSHPSTYNPLGGTTYVSGTLPDLQTNNGAYMTFRSYASGTVTSSSYPSGYVLSGSTEYVSGNLTSLQADDSDYMTFSSNVTSKTDAFIAYKGYVPYTYPYPKNKIWNGESAVWSAEETMSNPGSPVNWVRTAVCPKSERALEKMVVTNTAGYSLYAYVSNGSSWTVTTIAGTYPISEYRLFDVAYEKNSGRALLVYSKPIYMSGTNRIGYKIWNGSAWSSEYLLDLPYTTGRVRWVCLASAPGTRAGTADDNEIAMIYLDDNQDVYGYIWNGSAWNGMGAAAVWDATVAIATEECIAVAYEQLSGRAMFIWGDSASTDNYYRIWDGSTLSSATLLNIPAQGGVTNWVTLKSNPISNELLFTIVDAGNDLNTAYWDGNTWTVHTEHDDAVDMNSQRCADFTWEPTGSNGLLVWGTNANQISYKTFTAPNTWNAQANIAMGGSTHYWVQLKTNPKTVSGDVKILGAVLDSNNDLGAISWNGTTFTVIGAGTITTDTTATNYECFEMEFMNFGASTEFASEVVFTGTSNTESWTQLTWTIDGSATTTDANVTFQLYNYQTGQYPTSGDGYMTGTIGTSDATLSQNITANPTYFRDVDGNWTMKITVVKATAEQFDWRGDLVRFTSTHPTEFTCEVEFTGTANTLNWTQLTWMVDSALTTDNVSVTLQLYNYTAGSYPTSGDGYIPYFSSAIAGTDETFSQIITANMTDFRDNLDGNWTIRITGVKTGDTQFDLNVDLVELSSEPVRTYRLRISNTFAIDLLAYPHIRGLTISVRYNVTEATEKWFLEAYNWTASSFSSIGFNDTDGHQPTQNSWNEFTISVTDDWADYMQGNSTLIEFHDEGLPANQTVAEIDFLGVTPLIDGVQLELENMGSSTTHIVSLWIMNSTSHQRYDVNFFLNSGEEKTYADPDIILPEGDFVVKIITERGNIAVALGR